MQGELFYGNDDLFSRSEHSSSNDTFTSAFNDQKDREIENVPHLDVYNSNTWLDHYLFYFSSKL